MLKKSFSGKKLFLVCLVLFGILSSFHYVDAGNISVTGKVFDANGVIPLPGTGLSDLGSVTPNQPYGYIQCIYAGDDGMIDAPNSDGSTTGDDVLLGSAEFPGQFFTAVGEGFPSFPPLFFPEGRFFEDFNHSMSVGAKIYCRAWNNDSPLTSDMYGNSLLFALTDTNFDNHVFEPWSTDISIGGSVPEINVAANIDFGDVFIGSSSKRTLTIENTGSANLDITSIVIKGSSSNDFMIDPLLIIPVSIPAGEEINAEITYTPLLLEQPVAEIEIGSNDEDEQVVKVTIAGRPVLTPKPEIEVTQLSVDHGDVFIGSSSIRNIVIENIGTADLEVNSIGFKAGGSSDFALSSLPVLPLSIPLGESVIFDVIYNPLNEGADSGTVLIASNDTDEQTVSVLLSGKGIALPEIEVSPLNVDNGDVFIGLSSSNSITIENLGMADLEISNIGFGVSSSSDFALSALPLFPMRIAFGASEVFDVIYDPSDEGLDSGTVLIESDDVDEPTVMVSLSGNGLPVPEIDLCNWQVVQYEFDHEPDSDWEVSGDCSSVMQTVNADASILLSNFDVTDKVITGHLQVNTSSPDDGLVGIVFAHQSSKSFYLFDWQKVKENDNTENGGMSLKIVNAGESVSITAADLRSTNNNSNVTILRNNSIGWEETKEYTFRLEFHSGNFNIQIMEGDAVLETWNVNDSTFDSGQFGLYCFSQDGVLFRDIAQTIDATQTIIDTHTFISGRAVGLEGNVAEEDVATGKVTTLSSASIDFKLTHDSDENKEQEIGIRFADLNVPQGAKISEAFIQFESGEIQTGPVKITFKGEVINNAPLFKEIDGDVSRRQTTNASVEWSITDDWDVDNAGFAQRTPNLRSVMQEIVDGSDWRAGNAIAFIAVSEDFPNHRTAKNGVMSGPVFTVDFQTETDVFVSEKAAALDGTVAEEDVATGEVKTRSSASNDLELTSDSEENKEQIIGLLFDRINIEGGVNIVSATIQFESSEDQGGEVSITLEGEKIGNALLFQENVGNVSMRSRTNEFVVWDPIDWIIGDAGFAQQTPNLKEIVQEVINGTNWKRGNAIAIVGESQDFPNHRTAQNGDNKGPILTIKYSEGEPFKELPPVVQPTNEFSDILNGGTTEGSLDDAGDQILTITDELDPVGFKISADLSGGPTPATISVCGGASTFSVEAGDELIVTCGSVIVEVVKGTIEITFVADDGTRATTTVEAGNGLTFDPTAFSITVPTTSSPVVVTVDGQEIIINTGETKVFERTLVELVDFSATASRNGVILNWETATEIDNAGFNILRAKAESEFVKINESFIPAEGNTAWGAKYSYTDKDIVPGSADKYLYKLEDVELDGDSTLHGPVSATVNKSSLRTR